MAAKTWRMRAEAAGRIARRVAGDLGVFFGVIEMANVELHRPPDRPSSATGWRVASSPRCLTARFIRMMASATGPA